MENKRVMDVTVKQGLQISDLILVAVLLAAGAVLKLCVGSVINLFGMKPNFIIAMYCLAILLIRPKITEAAVIGLLAGAVCQFLPGSPYINFISEFLGAAAMAVLIRIPMKFGKFNIQVIISTLLATLISGAAYTICLFVFMGAAFESLAAYVPIVGCTAIINCMIVQILYIPLKAALRK